MVEKRGSRGKTALAAEMAYLEDLGFHGSGADSYRKEPLLGTVAMYYREDPVFGDVEWIRERRSRDDERAFFLWHVKDGRIFIFIQDGDVDEAYRRLLAGVERVLSPDYGMTESEIRYLEERGYVQEKDGVWCTGAVWRLFEFDRGWATLLLGKRRSYSLTRFSSLYEMLKTPEFRTDENAKGLL